MRDQLPELEARSGKMVVAPRWDGESYGVKLADQIVWDVPRFLRRPEFEEYLGLDERGHGVFRVDGRIVRRGGPHYRDRGVRVMLPYGHTDAGPAVQFNFKRKVRDGNRWVLEPAEIQWVYVGRVDDGDGVYEPCCGSIGVRGVGLRVGVGEMQRDIRQLKYGAKYRLHSQHLGKDIVDTVVTMPEELEAGTEEFDVLVEASR